MPQSRDFISSWTALRHYLLRRATTSPSNYRLQTSKATPLSDKNVCFFMFWVRLVRWEVRPIRFWILFSEESVRESWLLLRHTRSVCWVPRLECKLLPSLDVEYECVSKIRRPCEAAARIQEMGETEFQSVKRVRDAWIWPQEGTWSRIHRPKRLWFKSNRFEPRFYLCIGKTKDEWIRRRESLLQCKMQEAAKRGPEAKVEQSVAGKNFDIFHLVRR